MKIRHMWQIVFLECLFLSLDKKKIKNNLLCCLSEVSSNWNKNLNHYKVKILFY